MKPQKNSKKISAGGAGITRSGRAGRGANSGRRRRGGHRQHAGRCRRYENDPAYVFRGARNKRSTIHIPKTPFVRQMSKILIFIQFSI